MAAPLDSVTVHEVSRSMSFDKIAAHEAQMPEEQHGHSCGCLGAEVRGFLTRGAVTSRSV